MSKETFQLFMLSSEVCFRENGYKLSSIYATPKKEFQLPVTCVKVFCSSVDEILLLKIVQQPNTEKVKERATYSKQ